MSDKYHIATINFEAGDHAMPQNPLEIGLALRAAKVAWEKYPYLEHRYGERGSLRAETFETVERACHARKASRAHRGPAAEDFWIGLGRI